MKLGRQDRPQLTIQARPIANYPSFLENMAPIRLGLDRGRFKMGLTDDFTVFVFVFSSKHDSRP
jgi:hypothetical protein